MKFSAVIVQIFFLLHVLSHSFWIFMVYETAVFLNTFQWIPLIIVHAKYSSNKRGSIQTKSEACDLYKQVSAFVKRAQAVHIFPIALSCIFWDSFKVHKSKLPYDLFKYPLNRHTCSFHRFVKVLLLLQKMVTFKGSSKMRSHLIGRVTIYTKKKAINPMALLLK